MFDPGDVVVVDFPGIQGIKRRSAIILSSALYHAARPDVILGLLTSQTSAAIGPTDYLLQDWAAAGLRLPSAFRAFLVTLPRSDIIMQVGHLSENDWQGVRNCVKSALAALEST